MLEEEEEYDVIIIPKEDKKRFFPLLKSSSFDCKICFDSNGEGGDITLLFMIDDTRSTQATAAASYSNPHLCSNGCSQMSTTNRLAMMSSIKGRDDALGNTTTLGGLSRGGDDCIESINVIKYSPTSRRNLSLILPNNIISPEIGDATCTN